MRFDCVRCLFNLELLLCCTVWFDRPIGSCHVIGEKDREPCNHRIGLEIVDCA